MLEIGKKAPAFTAVTDSGEKISLKDFKGEKVILYFYPKDMTPGCTQESCDFQSKLTGLKRKGVKVIGVSKDSVERHVKFKEKYGLKFPLIADEDGKVCEKYGVWQEKKNYGKTYMGIVRSTFVIDENQKIQNIYTKVRVKGHVDKVIEEL